MSLAMKLLPMVGSGASPAETDPFWSDVDTLIHVVDGVIVDAKGKTVNVQGDVGIVNDATIGGSVAVFPATYTALLIGANGDFNFLHDNSTSWTVDAYLLKTSGSFLVFNTAWVGTAPGSYGSVDYTEACMSIANASAYLVQECDEGGLSDSTWHHVAFRFDKDAQEISTVSNGVLTAAHGVSGSYSVANHWDKFITCEGTGRLGVLRVTKALRPVLKPTFPFPTS